MNENLVKILKTLTLSDKEEVTENILHLYGKKGNCIVHFLYFANIILSKLDKNGPASLKKKEFIQALLGGEFLLPDGIALKLLYKKYFKKIFHNLNGTDFLPYFLSHIPKDKPVEILLYGSTDDVISKATTYITTTFGHHIISARNGFEEFDWSEIKPKQSGTIRILLVGRGSPLQEIWTEQNKKHIEEMECITFTVGGLLDFWSGTERRAPEWVRSLRMEWLYRAISNPRKNLKKTLVSLQLVKFLIAR